MPDPNSKQDIDIALLKKDFESLEKLITEKFKSFRELFEFFEAKNCKKHQEILETTNKYRGEILGFLKETEQKFVSKESAESVFGLYNKFTNFSGWLGILVITAIIAGLVWMSKKIF